jgi:ABC-type amino acid transport substrate-binding protein
MMMIQRALLVFLAAGAAALPADAAAQRFGPSVEASLGVSTGGGGLYAHRTGGAMDAVLAMPIAGNDRGTVVLGLTGTANGPVAVDDICMVGPDAECMDDYPTFMSLGVVAGVQRRLGASLSSRVLAGPAYYQSVDGDDTFGVQGRVDVAKPLLFRTAIVASLRGSLLPRYEGESLHFAAFGLGLRIQ